MMFKSKKNKEISNNKSLRVKFVIPQITESYEGLRTSRSAFKKSEFASSLYGSGIKDVSTYHDNALEGIDVNKTYDNFRPKEEKRITDEDLMRKYGTKYPEFQQMNLNTAKEVYGEEITVNKVKHLKEAPVVNEFSFVKQKEEYQKPKIEEVKEDNENITDNSNDDMVSQFNFGLSQDNDNDIESFKPSIQITDLDEDTFFNNNEEKTYTNIVKRTPEEMAQVKLQGTRFIEKETTDTPVLEKVIEKPSQPSFVSKEENEEKHVELPKIVNPYGRYILPPIDRFKCTTLAEAEMPSWLVDKKDIINDTLNSFDITGEVENYTKGPTFTRYEVLLANGVNVRKVANLQDTFQANLGVTAIRIQAPIPGKRTVGIEVPNDKTETVWYGDIVSDEFVHDGKPLNVALGKDIDGNIVTSDISKWPHGLVAGSTGSGKSVCINTILVSLLLKNKPDELKLILVDPKQVELITYNELPHLITPVISDPKMASQALKWSVDEMERRYGAFAANRVRSITDYNDKIKEDHTIQKMPYIVIVIDELADLMQVCSSDVEDSIQRLTQKARAAGIHLICATQRPTTDVVKGTIKNNIPTRLAFKVTSQVDSFTILDEGGAESLLGKGDMLLKEIDRPKRLQGAYIPDKEIDFVTDFIKNESEPNYVFDHNDLKAKFEQDSLGSAQNNGESEETLYQAARFFIESETCSVNMLQQQFNFGFNRASRVVSALEELGVVSGKQGTKGREILVNVEQLNEIFERDE